jgi:glycosyltransferase involved in cell wall biosynthesis
MGGAELLSSEGLLLPEDVRALSIRGATVPSAKRVIFRALPPPARKIVAECRRWYRGRKMRLAAKRMADRPYRLVMQLHSRHQDCGLAIARRVGAPFVLRVEALEIREDAKWGTRRPIWGNLAERWGELRIIRQADLVASVSEAVDTQLAEAGIRKDRRVIIPNGVDLTLFSPGEPDADLLRANDLEGRFVIGWVGGFRPFHGLGSIPAIADRLRAVLPGAVLCLVGTGPEREEVARRTARLGDVVRFVGPISQSDVPRWLRSFDACLLLADSDDFHYSPLKLYEYMGCGRPVVAAAVGEVRSVVSDNRSGMLVPPKDPGAVVEALCRLAGDQALRHKMGAEARRTAEASGSWEARAATLLAAVESRGLFRRQSVHRS